MATATAPRPAAPIAFYVPNTYDGIVCGLCTSSMGMEVRHADVDDVATCAALRFEVMGIRGTDAEIPAWLS